MGNDAWHRQEQEQRAQDRREDDQRYGYYWDFRLDKTFTIFTRFGVKTRDNPDSKDSLGGSVLASVHPRKFRCHDEIRPISGISVLAPRDNAGLSIRRQLALYFPDQSNP
jgi:hypothetical protein